MALYADTDLPLNDALQAFHADELHDLARAGTWLDGEERVAVAAAARAARVAAGVQPAVEPAMAAADTLPGATLELVERVAVAPRDCRPGDPAQAAGAGISDGEYVETVSVVSRIVNLDVFARGIGVAPRALPAAVAGEPSCERPASVTDEGAWLSSVPAGAAGGDDAIAAYGNDGPQPFIYRALSLVPAESRRCIAGGDVQYLPIEKFMDFGYSHQPGLTRAQVEVVAARISALNDCFY